MLEFLIIYIYAAYTQYSGLCDSVVSLGKTHVSELETSKVQVPANISAQRIWQKRPVHKFRKYLEMDNALESTIFKGEDVC